MTSRIMNLYRIFTRSGQVTSAGPNSWASIGLWRRFIEMKEQEEEEQAEAIVETMEEVLGLNGNHPIDRQDVVQARKDFVLEYHRRLSQETGKVRTAGIGSNYNSTGPQMEQYEHQQLNRPNLSIPVDNSHVTLAQ